MKRIGYLRYFGYFVAVAVGLGIIWIGSQFLLDPGPVSSSFGVPNPPPADDPFLLVKGVRDIGAGVVILALLNTRQRLGLAVALLAASIIPVGDALIVLGQNGSVAVALGVHGATAAAMILGALTLFTSREVNLTNSNDTKLVVR